MNWPRVGFWQFALAKPRSAGRRGSTPEGRPELTLGEMFVSLPTRPNGPRRWLALVVGLVAVATFTAGTVAVSASGPSDNFAAQGGRWDRASDVTRSPYVLQTPNVGSRSQFGQPLYHGVVAWQQLLNENGARLTVDGAYGPRTQAAVKSFQQSRGLEPTGVLGYPTAKALLDGIVDRNAKKVGMPTSLLMCHLAAESNLDPSAVGLNGSDMGIAQISLPHNPGVTSLQAFDIEFAIEYMAKRDAKAYKRYGDWGVAVVSYNSPVAANRWQATGTPSELARTYSQRVLGSC